LLGYISSVEYFLAVNMASVTDKLKQRDKNENFIKKEKKLFESATCRMNDMAKEVFEQHVKDSNALVPKFECDAIHEFCSNSKIETFDVSKSKKKFQDWWRQEKTNFLVNVFFVEMILFCETVRPLSFSLNVVIWLTTRMHSSLIESRRLKMMKSEKNLKIY